MLENIQKIKIGQIWNGGNGASMTEELDVENLSTPDLDMKGPLTAEISIYRLKDGVSVVINNLSVVLASSCVRCLEKFNYELHINSAESHFVENLKEHKLDDHDFYAINLKDLSIDLSDALIQEIILHFPMIPVCSERCKGLCASCNVNLNKHKHLSTCSLDEQAAEIDHRDKQRPFSNLKDLIDSNRN